MSALEAVRAGKNPLGVSVWNLRRGRLSVKTALSWLPPLEPDHMRCCGSEVLTQSRAHALQSSLTDLHIACELTASRDSGTDASQANAASTAGSAARRGGTAHALEPLRQAEDELSPAVIR